MRYILFPLAFLVCLALLSQLGMGASEWSTEYAVTGVAGGYYDSGGRQVAYGNGSAVDEVGHLETLNTPGGQGPWNLIIVWHNSTGQYTTFNDVGDPVVESSSFTFDINSSYAVIGLIIALMAVGTIAGVQIFGNGLSSTSVSLIILGTALIGIWAIFSVLSMSILITIPWFGSIFYFFLTVVYTVGIVQQISGGGGGD